MFQLQFLQLRLDHKLTVTVAGLVQEIIVLMIVLRWEKGRDWHDLRDDGPVKIFLSRLLGLLC